MNTAQLLRKVEAKAHPGAEPPAQPEPQMLALAPSPPGPAGALPHFRQYEAERLAAALGLPGPVHLGHGLWGIVAEVTPEMAYTWLTDHNVKNRPFIEGHSARHGDDLTAGRWRLHHQGIAFRADGRLQDGQHRLFAIFDTGVTALVAVYLNVSDEAQGVIDSARSRRPEDVAALTGQDADRWDVAVVRRAYFGMSSSTEGWSNQHALTMVARHREPLTYARALIGGNRRLPAPMSAAVVRAWYATPGDKARLSDFGRVLTTGARADGALGPEDSAAPALQRWLGVELGARPSAAKSQESAGRIFGKTCRAIEAFLAREPLAKWPVPEREIYHLPG